MWIRSLAVWCLLLVAAIANAGVREGLLAPRFGEQAGHVLSTLTLSLAILAIAWLTIGWLAPATVQDVLWIGGLWLLLTVAFEFLAGHYLFGNSWESLLADYDLLRGRVWVLVLVTTAVAPLAAAAGRGVLGGRP